MRNGWLVLELIRAWFNLAFPFRRLAVRR